MATESHMNTAGRTSTHPFRDLRSASRASHRRHKHLSRYNYYRDLYPEELPTPANTNQQSQNSNTAHHQHSSKHLKRDAFAKSKLYAWNCPRPTRLLDQAPKRQSRIFGNKDDDFEIRSEDWRLDVPQKEELDRWVNGMNDMDLYFAFGRNAEYYEWEFTPSTTPTTDSTATTTASVPGAQGQDQDQEQDEDADADADIDEGYSSESETPTPTLTPSLFPVDPITHYHTPDYNIQWHRDWTGNWMSTTWGCGNYCYCDVFDADEPTPIAPRRCALDEYAKGDLRWILEQESEQEAEWEVKGYEEWECDWEEAEWDKLSVSTMSSEAWSEVEALPD